VSFDRGISYPVKTHLHDEEDGHAEARGESDNGGDGNRHGLAVELGELRELDAGGGDDRFAAARGAQSDASGCASGAGQANGLAGAARAPGEGGRRRAGHNSVTRDRGHHDGFSPVAYGRATGRVTQSYLESE